MRKYFLGLALAAVAAFSIGAAPALAGADPYCNNVSANAPAPPSVGGQIVSTTSFWNCSTTVIDEIQFYDDLVQNDTTTFVSSTNSGSFTTGGGTVFHYLNCPGPGQRTWNHITAYRYHLTGTPYWTQWYSSNYSTGTTGACA